MQWRNFLRTTIARTSLTSLALLAASAPAAAAKGRPGSDWCPPLVARLPKISLAECRNSQLTPTGIHTPNGFPLLARELPADARHPNATRVLLLGGIHGDEQSAAAIVFKWLEYMQQPGEREFEWKVAPVVNPDGLLAPTPRRVNAHGVDLNRNFPTPNWQQEAPRYWARATRSDPRRYPGKAPISEPESRWVHDTIEKFKPDVIISVHAPFGVLDFDGPATPPRRFGRLIYQRVGVYPGSLGNYSGLHKEIPVVTIELANASLMPPEAEVRRIWQDMQSWIRRNVNAPLKTARNS
ncbi:MAG: succinylglutamate desuccinylase/aspartoacylase family protein [Burkholderiales bacterium]|nr:succinylglutamate desuccinylase/aspartoacylase family protein [Burkholderiales bacterium]